MRVLHVYKTYYPDTFGGVEQVIQQLSQATHALGIRNTLLVTTPQGKGSTTEYPWLTVHSVPSQCTIASTPFALGAFSAFRSLAAQHDIIQYHFPWPFGDCLSCWAGVKRPSIISYHSDIVKQKYLLKVYEPLMHHCLRKVDAIIAGSPEYAASSPVLSQYRSKVQVIPYGLDARNYPGPSAELLDAWRKQVGEGFWLFVGTLRYYKGLHYLLQALPGLRCKVVIAGTGPEEEALKHQAQALRLQNVHFVGSVTDADKCALYALSAGFVFPSHLRSEAFGMSMLEAAVFKKPLICCDIQTGTTYINKHMQTGLVVPPANPAALRSALEYMCAHPDQAKAMGEAMYERYQAVFSSTVMGQDYAALYAKLRLGRPPAAA